MALLKSGDNRVSTNRDGAGLSSAHSLFEAMDSNRFENHITVKVDATGAVHTLRTPTEAYQFLLGSWNAKRSEKYRAALQACSDASLGGKTTMAARRAVLAVAREAGILYDEMA